MDDLQLPAVDPRQVQHRSGEQSFVFPAYSSLQEWERRARELREHLAVVTGLLPRPDLRPRWAGVTPCGQGPGYTVDRVALMGDSGLLCTGNLYRPVGRHEPAPAILNPHGHWDAGRLEHSAQGSVRARCITFARMGMLALSYDMVGYNDSLQIADHHFSSRRGALWGLTSLSLQLWNSLTALEFLCSLAEVDVSRIGCTGASGGASQALLLTALDDRISVTAPVNMISAHFQGGCECENTPALRLDTCNVEIAALAAPRPMLMVSATGDWTCNTPQVEFPALQSIYRLYGRTDDLAHVQIDAGHNYNADSRAPVYRWFARWFGVPQEQAVEHPFALDADERLRVFPTAKLPENVPDASAFPDSWREHALSRQASLLPDTVADLEQLRVISTLRLKHVLGVRPPEPDEDIASCVERIRTEHGYVRNRVILGRPNRERIQCVEYVPDSDILGTAVLVDPAGIETYTGTTGEPGPLVDALLKAGFAACIPAPFSRLVPPGAPARRDSDWYWSCFNRCVTGEQVLDLLIVLAYLVRRGCEPWLIGHSVGGVWALLAAAISPTRVAVCVDMTELDLDVDEIYLQHLDIPQVRAFDLCSTAAAMIAPRSLLLSAQPGWTGREWVSRAYTLAQASNALRMEGRPLTIEDMLSCKRHS